ncbi:MAG: VCBS repeat-containing protein [Acidobacteria bacterium]|nr:VCBS repeat-containing protein [Acidobacteriota bacterium]
MAGLISAQSVRPGIWSEKDPSTMEQFTVQPLRPTAFKVFGLDGRAMRAELNAAPEEFSASALKKYIELPMPNGTLQKFEIEHSPIIEKGLADKFPALTATYTAHGVDDPTATARIDFLPSGFHSMVLSTQGTVLIDPWVEGDTENYIVYYKKDFPRDRQWVCNFDRSLESMKLADGFNANDFIPESSANVTSGTTLRQYRLALAADYEYCQAVGGGTVAGCQAAQVLVMNRVNGVYERDVAIRMNIIANNDLIIFAAGSTNCGGQACTAANDPYTNDDGVAMLTQNTTTLNNVIGTANYDIGHVVSTGGGGVANLNGPCGSNKARGVTGLPNPVGDPFAIDYVAHEMGHQWGANHTFNSTVSNCSGNRSGGSAYEPGSGITIMGYAGICGNQNLSNHSIDTFHVKSLEVIVNYSQVGNGNTCAVSSPTNNTPPTVSVAGTDTYNIPKGTPFALTAAGSDQDGDSLTYDWQEYDLGSSTTAVPNTDADGNARPILRPYPPTAGPTRLFPSLQYILYNANVPPATNFGFLTGELLPAITRTMKFQVVARDNRLNGGGINTATATVNVDGNSGPFKITAPNTAGTFNGGSSVAVTWDAANTASAPVSAANVKISLSADGGLTFTQVLSASTPNDGSESVTLPNIGTNQARIKVEAVNNIFFDISDANFTINSVPSAGPRAPFDYDGDNKTDLSIYRPSVGQWWHQRSSDGGNYAVTFGNSSDKIVPADFTGDQKTDWALFRPSTGEWFVLRSNDLTYYAFPFGTSGDIPVTGDFDGDGKADAVVFRPSNNTWFIQKSGGGTDIFNFGASGDKPVVGDYDGDGKVDIAIYRPSVGEWWLRKSSNGAVFAATFGSSTDRPVPGYWTADNKADIAFWRPSTGQWFILRSEDFSYYASAFGANGDVPVPGDYDGDGRFDTAVFRPSNNTWYIQRSTAGTLIQAFGSTGDIPTPSAYVP